MQTFSDWVKSAGELILKAGEFIINLTLKQLLRVTILAIFVFLLYRMLTVEDENRELIVEKRGFERECNEKINHVKDSLTTIINMERLDRQAEKNKMLEDQVNQLKKLEENANRIKRNNDRILKNKK